jgi:hypothetical protein
MASVGDYIAIYAALVGTGSLGWQIRSAAVARRPGITVKVSNAGHPYPGHMVWHVAVAAVNRGERPVEVTGAGLYLQDGSGGTLVPMRVGPLDKIPGTVEPHHSIAVHLPVDWLEQQGLDLKRPLRGFVNIADGTVDSKPVKLRS